MKLSKIKEKTNSFSKQISESKKKYLNSTNKYDFEKTTRLFFKKIFLVLKKNYYISTRNPKLYLSLIIAPLIFVILVGMAFNTSQLRTEMKISIYDETPNNLIEETFEEIAIVSVISSLSEENCERKVKDKETLACIAATIKEDETDSYDVNIYLDFTRMSVYPNVYTLIRDVLSVFERQITINFLKELRTELDPDSLGLEEIKKDLEAAEQELFEASEKLNEMSTSLSSDSSFYIYKIDEVIETMIQLEEDINLYQELIQSYRTEMASHRQEINKAYQDTKSARESMEEMVDLCGPLGEDLSGEIEDLIDIIDADPEVGCTGIKTIHGLLWTYEQAFKGMKQSLDAADKDLENAQEQLDELKQSTNLYIAELELEKQQINATEEHYSVEIISFQERLEVHSAMIIEYTKLVEEAKEDFTNLHTALDPYSIINKFEERFKQVPGDEKNMLDYSLHIIIPFILLLSSLLISITLNRNDYKTSAYQRNKMLKNNFLIFSGNTLFVLIIMLIEVLFIFILFNTLFGSDTLLNLGSTLLFSSVFILIWSIIGFLISRNINSDEGAIYSGTILGLLVFFLSGVIVPVESFPSSMMYLYSANPFVYFSDVLRSNFIMDGFINLASKELLFLSGIFIIVLAISSAILWRDMYANNS